MKTALDTLSDSQADAMAAIVKWHGDGGWPPLTLGGLAGTGKGHPHGTGILTPAGFTPVEDILPGDLVTGSDGQPVKVLDTYRRGVLLVYRVTFNDGSSVRVDGDHLWAARTNSMDRHSGAYRAVKTRELACSLHKRWGIPQVSAPVEMDERELPIDPYILGVLLGDGAITQARALFTPGDVLVPAEVARRLPEGLVLNCHQAKPGKADAWCITWADGPRGHQPGGGHARNPVVLALDNLGLLGKPAAGKFIPDDYLYASASQRLDLLRGLMDTDGELHTRMDEDHILKLQIVTQFSSASEVLCNQVQFLIESFGGVARKSIRQAPKYTYKGEHRTGQPSYRLNINSTVNPFLTRDGWGAHGHRKPKRVIRSIEPDGEAEVTCLRVDAADSIYLTEHCVVTHNTTLVGLLPDVLPKRTQIAYASFTGKAVSVLASKLPPGEDRVSTLHRLLYSPAVTVLCALSGAVMPGKAVRCSTHYDRPEPCPVTQQVSFAPKPDPLAGLDLVVADEASMIPERLWQDLTSHGVPVLAVGDHGQLPPVRSSFNLMAYPDLRLEEIHRQAAGSPILAVARWAREQGHIPHGWYGPEVCKIRPDELGYAGLHPGDADMIICATNATRQYHNAAMRAWHGRSGPPGEGDRVICLKNSYDAGLFNGQRGVVLESCPGDGDTYRMTVGFDGLDDPWEGPVAVAPFGAPPAVAGGIRDRDLAVLDFGYALTAHKCVDDITLILTRSGWKSHADLAAGEQVLTLNPETQLSEWQPVLDIHRYQVTDEQLLSIEAESHSSLTTLNHRWPAKDYRGRIVFTDSRYLYENPANYPSLAKAAVHGGFPDVPKYSDAFVELAAWFWTEGHILSNKGGQIGAVTITQSETANPENVVRIRAALLAEFGLPRERLGRGRNQDPSPAWTESWSHPGGQHRADPDYRYWRFGLNNSAGQSLQDCAPGMILRPEFILALTRSQLDLFIHVSMLGDGHTEYVGAQSYGVIRQKDRRWLEGFQFACTLAGYSTVMRQTPGSGMWWMRLKTGQFLHPRVLASQLVPYTGTVWCPETANGTWFAKRNETTYFTGNSQGSAADKVLVIEESWPDPGTEMRRRWLYTAVTRAVESLTVVGWLSARPVLR